MRALIRPDNTVQAWADEPFDLTAFGEGYTQLPVNDFLKGQHPESWAITETEAVPTFSNAAKASHLQAQCLALGPIVDAWTDQQAQARGYTSIVSVCSYTNSTNPAWKADADTAVAWRDSVWSAAIAIQEAVISGARPLPTSDALIAELPKIVWPS